MPEGVATMPTTKNNVTILRKVREHPEMLQALSPHEFEELIAHLLSAFGWKLQRTTNGADSGCDFSAISEVAPGLPVTWVVQCKFLPTPRAIGVEELRNLYGAKIDAGASNGVLVTNARFTSGARSFAESKGDLH